MRFPRFLIWGLVSCVFAVLLSHHAQAAPQAPGADSSTFAVDGTVQQNVVYGRVKGTELHLDVYQPVAASPKPLPAVILIHGGGWSAFDKSTMRGMGGLLSRSGLVAFAVDYRLYKAGENRWPATGE
jgi:acetyl esterase/lipase